MSLARLLPLEGQEKGAAPSATSDVSFLTLSWRRTSRRSSGCYRSRRR